MDNFTIILPSNVINHNYENTIANYKTHLPIKQNLSGEWNVGLSAISYTRSWLLPQEEEFIGLYYYHRGCEFKYIEKFILVDISNHQTAAELVEVIKVQRDIEQQNIDYTLPEIVLNETLNRIEIKVGNRKGGPVFFIFGTKLSKVLGVEDNHYMNYIDNIETKIDRGFDTVWEVLRKNEEFMNIYTPVSINENEKIYFASAPVNINNDHRNIYIFCDIIKHCIVGDKTEQLLRIVEVPNDSKMRQQISFNFEDIQYHKLMSNEFTDIKISIKDENGNLIDFNFGRVIATLHFKKYE